MAACRESRTGHSAGGKQGNGDSGLTAPPPRYPAAGTARGGGRGDDDLTTDCDSDGVEGVYPPSLMTASQMNTSIQMRDRSRPPLPPPQDARTGSAEVSGTHTAPSSRSHPPPGLATGSSGALAHPTEESHGSWGVSGSDSQSAGRLGIETARPKFPQYVTETQRLRSFEICGHRLSHSVQSYAEAGLFYAGYGDCVRCFFCGVGLRSWEPQDNPWVEHARWSPSCPFVLLTKKPDFVSAVQALAESADPPPIQLRDVEAEMRRQLCPQNKNLGSPCHNMHEEPHEEAAEEHQGRSDNEARQRVQQLQRENETLRDQRRCKVCWDNDVSVLFLPCGHLSSCGACAFALEDCPFCRRAIQGRVSVQQE